ncbi:MAG: Na+:solute symporter [Nitrospirota bacterium]
MALSLAVGLYLTKRASTSLSEFFLSGRNLPWWLAGTSMVATTFSSDTPLYVTGLVRAHGIYENWQWWCFIMWGMMGVFFFARLWRRLGVLTDVELIEMRYSRGSARVLRGFKAVYFSCVIHTIIKAQVILAMAKILDVTLGWRKWESIAISSLVTLAYSVMSGYWGVVTTDLMQFAVAVVGAVALAIISVDKVGGLQALRTEISPEKLSFFPPLDGEFAGTAFMAFLGYVGLAWWSKFSSDGGGVVVQRISSCRNEREGLLATFYFNVANYALRTWPWVIVALASLLLYPRLTQHEAVYPLMVVDLLPSGLRGLMVASFFAAFMSTLSTYLNLSSAYFVNDFYRPFLVKDRDDRHYIFVSRAAAVALSALTAVVTLYVTSIVGVFKFLIAFGSGTGLVYILRWFWWRVNAWSEISAMVASTAMTLVAYRVYPELPYYGKLALIISVSTAVWVAATYVTGPTDMDKLVEFVRRARPGGPGWGPVRRLIKEPVEGESLSGAFLDWAAGSLFVVGLTLGIGKLLLGYFLSGYIWLLVSLVTGWLLKRRFATYTFSD